MIRILHVDDEKAENLLLKTNLKTVTDDIDMQWVDSASKALKVLENEEIDCIISDYQMAGMDGLSLLVSLNERGVDIPFIFLTGQGNEQLAAEALRAGAVDYYTKDRGFAYFDRIYNSIVRNVTGMKERREKKLFESELETSEEKFRIIFENKGTAAGIAGEDGVILHCNEALAELSGYSKSELINEVNFSELIVKEDLEQLSSHFDKNSIAAPNQFECGIRARNGEVRTAIVNVAALGKERIISLLDITDRKQAEEVMHSNEAKYRLLIENLPQKIFMKDINSVYVSCNDKYAKDIGIDASDITGKTDYDLYPAELADKYVLDDKRIMSTGEPEEIEEKYCHSGKEIFVQTVKTPIKDDQGNISGILGIFWDITERKKTDEALREKEAMIRNLATQVPGMLYQFMMKPDGSLSVPYSSQGVEDIFGCTPEQVRDDFDPIFKVIQDKEKITQTIQESVENMTQWKCEYRVRLPGASVKWVYGNSIPEKLEDGSIVWYGYNIDITEQKQVEAKLEKAYEDLSAANKELETFSYSVSHDLKAPVRHLIGCSNLLDENYSDYLDDDGKEMLTLIRYSSERMSVLIDSLLHLSRIQRSEIKRQDVDLKEIAEKILAEARDNDPGRKISFKTSGDLTARGDKGMLSSLMDNLLGNALKFTSKTDDAKVEVGAKNIEGRKTFYVADNGAGFDQAHSEKLFTPFQRLHSEEEFKGTGIGLATVQRIIKRHNGRIWAEGKPGIGATFYFTLGE